MELAGCRAPCSGQRGGPGASCWRASWGTQAGGTHTAHMGSPGLICTAELGAWHRQLRAEGVLLQTQWRISWSISTRSTLKGPKSKFCHLRTGWREGTVNSKGS